MTATTPSRRETWPLIGLFILALAAHFYFATANWGSGFMPGHEFRQAQTALVTYYIDQDDNFSLRYETPIFGKPWVALPLEVPFYEWSVVGLSRLTGLPHFKAARSITLACFYLTLPALYLLLGELGIARPRRLLALALVLLCPVYIFYSRAFLIESMELMGSAWFLLGFVRAMKRRQWRWLALATVAGTFASLIKNTTFAVWLLPAVGYTLWRLAGDFRSGRGWAAALRTALWSAGCVLVPLVALEWWLRFSDAIKAAHPSTFIFTSKNLSLGNFGLLNFASRFSPTTWRTLMDRWHEAIMTPWLAWLLVVVGALAFRTTRWRILVFFGLFLLAQALFPFAYAFQDYYYYACAIYLMGAFAFVLFGLLSSGLPAWLRWPLLVIPFVAQLSAYWHDYRLQQLVVSNGGSLLTDALRDITPPGSVFVIVGNDWAAMIPYYTHHKALMIRHGLEYDPVYLDRAFSDLDGEDVAAVLVIGEQRQNQAFLDRARTKFNLDKVPTLSTSDTDIYFSRFYRNYIIALLRRTNPYSDVKIRQDDPVEQMINPPTEITPGVARTAFRAIVPGPFRVRLGYGFNRVWANGDLVLSAHPPSDIWLHAPAEATAITWDYGMYPDSYTRSGDKTDGVEFSATGEMPDGKTREIYRRLLDPARNPKDRGFQHVVIPYHPVAGETLVFSTRPNQTYAYDWAYITRIIVK